MFASALTRWQQNIALECISNTFSRFKFSHVVAISKYINLVLMNMGCPFQDLPTNLPTQQHARALYSVLPSNISHIHFQDLSLHLW